MSESISGHLVNLNQPPDELDFQHVCLDDMHDHFSGGRTGLKHKHDRFSGGLMCLRQKHDCFSGGLASF